MARIYREHPDSSYLAAPRIFVRVFCEPGELVGTVRFYEQLAGTRLDMDMDIPEAGLHVVGVGPFLILELDAEQHALAAQTSVTVLVPNLDEAVSASSRPVPGSCKSAGRLPSARAAVSAILTA